MSTTITPEYQLRTLAYDVVREQLSQVRANEAGTREGDDPEALHDLRVATRRLRAAVKTFELVLPPESEALATELSWLGGSLADVRDLDVQLARLSELTTVVAPADQAAIAGLRDLLTAERDGHQQRLLLALDSPRYAALLQRGADLLTRPMADPLSVTVGAAASPLVERPFRRFRKSARALTADSPPEDFHAVRKRARQLRYTVEFVAAVAPEPSRAFVQRLVQVQDILGQHQDAEVAMTQLRALADRGALPPGLLFALGGLAQRHATEAAELRGTFPAAYRAAVGRPWKQLRRRLRQTAGDRPVGAELTGLPEPTPLEPPSDPAPSDPTAP